MELTEMNSLYTYLERCKLACSSFLRILEKEIDLSQDDQDFLLELLVDGWQVEKVDILAETNKEWR
jgi:hypothetical protein